MVSNIKHSKQRDAIKEMLCKRTDHPTAEQLYNDLKPDFPKISLGTVYRNLSLLESMGEVIKIPTTSNVDRFDGRTDNHYHFYCVECNSVFDTEITVDTEINKYAEEKTGGKVLSHSLVFYGLCKNCKKSLDK